MDGDDLLHAAWRIVEMNRHKILIWVTLFLALEALLILFVDRPLSHYLREVDSTHPAVIDFFRSFTDLGKSKWYLWPSVSVLLFCVFLHHAHLIPASKISLWARIESALLFLFVSVAASGLAADLLK